MEEVGVLKSNVSAMAAANAIDVLCGCNPACQAA